MSFWIVAEEDITVNTASEEVKILAGDDINVILTFEQIKNLYEKISAKEAKPKGFGDMSWRK